MGGDEETATADMEDSSGKTSEAMSNTGEQWFEIAVELGDCMWGAGAHGDAICAPPGVDTEFSSAEGGNLKQPTRDHQILEEVDHLVLVGKVGVKREGGRNREDG
jgi:hypothetical protein